MVDADNDDDGMADDWGRMKPDVWRTMDNVCRRCLTTMTMMMMLMYVDGVR